jgi:hypothetical protein
MIPHQPARDVQRPMFDIHPGRASSSCSASPRLSTYALAALSWAMFGHPWMAPSAEALQASDTWIAAPLREVLTQGRDAGVFAIEDPADPTDPRFRQHLVDQLLHGVVAG